MNYGTKLPQFFKSVVVSYKNLSIFNIFSQFDEEKGLGKSVHSGKATLITISQITVYLARGYCFERKIRKFIITIYIIYILYI